MQNTDTYWDNIDFRPAPNGWQLAYLPAEPGQPLILEPLPGWLIQERVAFNAHTAQIVHKDRRQRRIVAAMVVPGEELYPASDHSHFWMEVGPGQVVTDDEVREAVEKRNADTR